MAVTDEEIRKRAGSLIGFHVVLAARLGPHWALSEDDALPLAAAMLEAERQYDFTFNPKVAAAFGLITTAAMIYGPRVAATAAAARARKAAQARPAQPFGGGRPVQPNEPPMPPPPNAEVVVGQSGVIVFPTGKPDRGKIDFGPT